ncbi:hypothetical protein [Salinicola rhizosphaerae]|uniref:Uncharacterized protein n=1 Tax=Salinicola rhizosphaerae TaxID=1443141 RepID=A0ABQ3E934_9GAMM|nr:hypothetical protein [Salinicola rhizosphaerae]GHB30356.1 hypothetical protein GCM10009038_31410 [Salinicola rhizosphaerae]
MTDSERALMIYHLGFVEEVAEIFPRDGWMQADRSALEALTGPLHLFESGTAAYYQRGRIDAVAYCFERPRADVRREIWQRYGPWGDHVQGLIVDE